MKLELEIGSPADMDAFGSRLAALLFPGAVVALIGQLGAGKTHLVRAIALGLGVEHPSEVTSPTFVLIQEYAARLPIYHFDVYRLPSEAHFADLGVHEYLEAGGVCIIEWADKVLGCLPDDRLQIEIQVTGPETRLMGIAGRGPYEKIVRSLAEPEA